MNNNRLNKISDFIIVDDNDKLKTCCTQAMRKNFITLDTEFVRVRTFYPKLGLIQLYDGDVVSLIDPLVITDFTPFIKLLKNQNVIKVLHACSEDLDVFKHAFNTLPEPMLDTQVMAQFLGAGNSAGLATLLKQYFGFEMDKGATRTDWLIRPLSEKQLNYAVADVAYLYPLYQLLAQKLQKNFWILAAYEDCQALVAKLNCPVEPEKLFRKMPQAQKLQDLALYRLQRLTAWRYVEARDRDLALNFVVKAENLWKVAKYGAKNNFDLLELGLHPQEVRINGKKILRILEECAKADPFEYPVWDKFLYKVSGYKQLTQDLRQQIRKNFTIFLCHSDEYFNYFKLAPIGFRKTSETIRTELFSNKKLIDGFLKWYYLDGQDKAKLPNLLKGWRKPIGKKLLNYMKTR